MPAQSGQQGGGRGVRGHGDGGSASRRAELHVLAEGARGIYGGRRAGRQAGSLLVAGGTSWTAPIATLWRSACSAAFRFLRPLFCLCICPLPVFSLSLSVSLYLSVSVSVSVSVSDFPAFSAPPPPPLSRSCAFLSSLYSVPVLSHLGGFLSCWFYIPSLKQRIYLDDIMRQKRSEIFSSNTLTTALCESTGEPPPINR